MASGQFPTAARTWTYLISGVLASASVALALGAPSGLLVEPAASPTVVVATLILAMLAAEQLTLNIEFRRQAYTLSLSSVPVVLAVLLAPADTQVLIRVVSSVAVLLFQRVSMEKIVFNASAYALDIALVGTAARFFLGRSTTFGLRTFLILLVVVLVVEVVVSTIILGVIRLHGVPFSRADFVGALVPALTIALASTALASAIVLLVQLGGQLGIVVVVLIAGVAGLAYRGYAATNRRHQSLELVHDFVADGVGAQSVETLAQGALIKIRALMRADLAELIVFDPDRGVDVANMTRAATGREVPFVRLSVGETEELQSSQRPEDASDWMLLRARTAGEPILLARNSKDPGAVSWLAYQGFRDAVIVPLPIRTASGVVIVSNRLGETATFTDDDAVLLHTLTRHLAVAMRSTRLVEKLTYDANHDSLTGLANRAHLNREIRSAVSDEANQAAVLLLDLDRFKEVNDTLGHDAGDRLLTVIAERVRAVVPAQATVARLGGDEFALLVPNHQGGRSSALELAHDISDAVRQPVHFEEAHLSPQASIGVALTGSGFDLLRQADTAMYAAKASDVPAVVYTPEMDQQRLDRLALLADLRSALQTEPEQFSVHYQPKVDLTDGAVTSFEALVRWRHPVRGMVAPDDFIALAESTGLIQQLTPIVLDAALSAANSWAENGHRISVAVNLSAKNVEDARLPIRVAESLRKHRVPAPRLILEITESSVMGDPDQTVPVLHELNKLGLVLSLDDFGTGYSSLSYLQQLPVQEVKVDRSFVTGLASPNPVSSRALIQSITGLGKNLGLRVVAEGVESAAQLRELRELGCDVAQGYHISKPLPASAVLGWLNARDKNSAPRLRLLAQGL